MRAVQYDGFGGGAAALQVHIDTLHNPAPPASLWCVIYIMLIIVLDSVH